MKKALTCLLVLMLLVGVIPVAYAAGTDTTTAEERVAIEQALNLANNMEITWSYAEDADAWTMSATQAVVNPELPQQQSVSVCVPGAYVSGIDTDRDGSIDVTAADYTEAVGGVLVIDYEAQIISPNGQRYTAATAPVILNTGAAGYGSSSTRTAATTYAKDGYVNVSCGNRGKQDAIRDENGEVLYYTGDAPCCLVDQKNAARFVKYNILLGNLPGSVDRFIATGGSGGAAHAAMFAATGNNPDFYDYEIEAGAVGVYRNADGSYSTTVTIDGQAYALSDGAWGCVAYSAITSLYEADMAMAFEYFMDPAHTFNTSFQRLLAAYLAEDYMEYINAQRFSVKEAELGFDLNGDGDCKDTIALVIEYDVDKYPETNGYGGSYCDLVAATFEAGIQKYLDDLDYATDWTWFDSDGKPMTDKAVAAMTHDERVACFLEGRYAKSSSGSGEMGGPGGGPSGESNTIVVDGVTELIVGTPNAGTTQAAGNGTNSNNYADFDEMLAAYEADVAAVCAGDEYGRNIVHLYDPMRYIGAEGTEDPVWTRIVMGAKEGDMASINSLNMQLKWLAAGTDAVVEWQYSGGHVPSEIFGDSFALYVDEMVAKHVENAEPVVKAAPEVQTENGTEAEATGAVVDWIDYMDGDVSVTLADFAAYRSTGAMKATPGFDVIDYGQEDYVFGNAETDARHWSEPVLNALRDHAEQLAPHF